MFTQKELVVFFDALDKMGDQTYYKFGDKEEIYVSELMLKVRAEVERLEEETPQ